VRGRVREGTRDVGGLCFLEWDIERRK
jgi:hypothetical protein